MHSRKRRVRLVVMKKARSRWPLFIDKKLHLGKLKSTILKPLLRISRYLVKKALSWGPRMACTSLCGYTNEIHRPHWSCAFFCRIRRFFYGKMDPKKYHYNRYMRVVLPEDQTTYVLFIDNKRYLANLKAAILKRLLTICEWLAN